MADVHTPQPPLLIRAESRTPIVPADREDSTRPPGEPAIAAAPARAGQLRISTLGQFRVERDGVPIADWRRQTAATLLKMLLVAERHRLGRDVLLSRLGPSARTHAAREALSSAVHALRRTLEPDLTAGEQSRYLVQEGEALALHLGPDDWVDLTAFEQALATADTAEDPLPSLETAAALYGGDLLPEETGEWCLAPREALRLRWHGLLLALQEAQTRQDRQAAAEATLVRLLAADPTQEEAARRLMGLLGRQGRRADALRVYEQLKRALRRELHARPATETEALARALRSGESLPRRRRAREAAPSGVPRARSRLLAPALVGRVAELSRVRSGLLAARDGHGQALLLTGEAGIGKTRLAEEAATTATMLGCTVLWGRSGEGEHDLPYAPFAEALRAYTATRPARALQRELAGAEAVLTILPELATSAGVRAPAPLGDPGAERLRLWTAVRALLAAATESRPIALVLEDLHWADDASAGLLAFLVRRCRDLRLLLLGTMRDELPEQHPLRRLILEGRREGSLDVVELEGLLPEEVATLAGQRLGAPLSPTQAAMLHAQCNGNPFFIHELLLLLEARRESSTTAAGGIADEVMRSVLDNEATLPGTVRQTLARRLDRLSIICRSLLRVGAVLGERFAASLLAQVAALDPAACQDALDEAVAAGLLREGAGSEWGDYALIHALLRRALYDELLPGQRRRLHARAAEALLGRARQGREASAELIAYHYARTDDHRRAALWLERAGAHAESVYAQTTAIRHYAQACARLTAHCDPLDVEVPIALARLHERLGDLRLLDGAYAEAEADFERARALVVGPLHQAQLWRKAGLTWEKRGDSERALALFDQAAAAIEGLSCAGAPEQAIAAFRAELALNRGEVYYDHGDYAAAEAAIDLALAVQGIDPEDAIVARAYNLRGKLSTARGAYAEAKAHHRRSLALFERLGDLQGIGATWNNLGGVGWYLCDYTRAEECYRRTLAFKERCGDQDGIATAWNNLGLVAASRGDVQEAEACHQRALAIQERTGSLRGIAHSLTSLGLMASQRCAFAQAEAYYQRAMGLYEQFSNPSGQALCRHSLGVLAMERGDYPAAESWLRSGLALCEQLGDPAGISHYWINLGAIALARGDLDGARALVARGLEVAEGAEYEPGLADGWFHLGLLAVERGDMDEAYPHLRRARRLIGRIGGKEERLMSALAMVRVYAHQGRTRWAARLLTYVERAVALQSAGPAELQLALVRAEVALQQGYSAAAESAASTALTLARTRGQRLEEGLALGLLGRSVLAGGRAEAAAPILHEALEYLEAIGAARHAARLRRQLDDAPPAS